MTRSGLHARRVAPTTSPGPGSRPRQASQAARLQATIGNRALVRLLQRYADLPTSQAGDRQEQEADQVGRDAERAAPRPLLDRSGTALRPASRAFFEARLGVDLARTRIHRGRDAQDAAAALDARAFTVRDDIFLGRRDAMADTAPGRALIGHELAHVAQQARRGAPALQRQALPPRPGPVPAAPGTLTNDALLAALAAERDWLAAHRASDAGFADRAARARALDAERSARAQAGAVWLDEPGADPLFTLAAQGNAVLVIEDRASRGATGARPSAPVFNQRQLDRMLRDLGIATVVAPGPAGAVGGALGTGRYTAGQYGGYAPLFAERVNPRTLQTAFPGNAGEYFYRTRTPGSAGRIDLNTRAWLRPRRPTAASPAPGLEARTTDFPVFDFLEALGERTSVKMSLSALQSSRFRYFDTGLSDIQGRSSPTSSGFTTFDQAVFNFEPPGTLRWPPSSPSLTPAERAAWDAARVRQLQRARLAVNPEDVVDYRQNVAQRIQRGAATYERLINAYLAQQPEVHSGTAYSTLAQIDAAPPVDRAAVLAQVAERIAATQIVPGGVTREGGVGLARVRTGMGLDPTGTGAAVRPDVQARAFPEALAVGELGYGPAMVRTVAPGAAVGGGAAAVTTLIVTPLRTGRMATGEQILVSGAGGTAGGALGAPLETALQARIAQTAMARALTSGGTALSTTGGAAVMRGLGGAGAAAPVAGLVTLGTMAYYDATDPRYNPAALDYFSGGGRAFVIGGLSGFASSALTFAMFGAALGPVGFVVGLILGVGLYLLADYLLGARVERGLRYLGEPALGPAQYPIAP